MSENEPIIEYSGTDVGVTITQSGESFVMTWTDYVANDWTEKFPSLSVALLRFALLINAGERDWTVGHVEEPEQFVPVAAAFMSAHLR